MSDFEQTILAIIGTVVILGLATLALKIGEKLFNSKGEKK